MTKPSKVTTIRLAPELIRELRKVAHQRSLEEEREITWTDIVRTSIEETLLTNKARSNTPLVISSND